MAPSINVLLPKNRLEEAEAALRKREERYRVLVENQGEGVAVFCRDRSFVLKVLFASGYTSEISDTGFRIRHGIQFLPNPYDGKTLCDAVERCLHAPSKKS